jgi:hypothetical protein
MAGESVVESPANIDSAAVAKSAAGSEDGSAGREPESLHCGLRVRDFKAHAFAETEFIVLELLDPFSRMYAQDIFVCCRVWHDDISRSRDLLGKQEITHHSEFLRLEDVVAQA